MSEGPLLSGIFPDTARVDPSGHLVVGGCDVVDLARLHGTPLYVYDEETIRARARAFRDALASYPARWLVCYAAKAYCAPWVLRLVAGEGLGLDVVSEGELRVAASVDFPRDRIYVHGNNKSEAELELATRERVGRVVVDNVEEIDRLAARAESSGTRQSVLLRIAPGVAARTHEHLRTGAPDTKFGVGIESGAAEEAVRRIVERTSLDLHGLHMHIGSQIGEADPYRAGLDRLFAFAARMRPLGLELRELNAGGGYRVRYRPDDPAADAAGMAREISQQVAALAGAANGEPPDLVIEPGRAIVAVAGIAVYRVGSVKRIPGVRTYVAVDGGMADNIRPVAYGAAYSAFLADRMNDEPAVEVTIAGRYCESGDVLVRDARVPEPKVGDLVVVPVSGAYHLSMASTYNFVGRPAVAVVAEGAARLVRRRETFQDLVAADL